MQNTAHLRRQHEELAALAGQLLQRIDTVGAPAGAEEARRLLATLTGTLQVHAAMEDRAVYPRLRAHPDERVRATAARLQEEFGPVYREVDAWSKRWLARGALEQDPAAFAAEARALCAALTERMATENVELYDVFDALSRA